MARLVRTQTNLDEVELAPFAHKYLLKRPRTHEHGSANAIVATQSSNVDGTHIDNPAVERRESTLLVAFLAGTH